MSAKYSTEDTTFGVVAAFVAIPFAWAAASLAAESQLAVLFFGSKWFTFKACFGVLELVVFTLAAAAHQSHRAERKKAELEATALGSTQEQEFRSGRAPRETGDASQETPFKCLICKELFSSRGWHEAHSECAGFAL
jgi:hypothetical protein